MSDRWYGWVVHPGSASQLMTKNNNSTWLHITVAWNSYIHILAILKQYSWTWVNFTPGGSSVRNKLIAIFNECPILGQDIKSSPQLYQAPNHINFHTKLSISLLNWVHQLMYYVLGTYSYCKFKFIQINCTDGRSPPQYQMCSLPNKL